MANEWPANGDPDWNTKMLANLAVSHNTDGTQKQGIVNMGTGMKLTIASGVITIITSYHAVDTESEDVSDDLNTITGTTTGDVLTLRQQASARNVTVRDSAGNIKLAGGLDFAFGNINSSLHLIYDGNNWQQMSASINS